MKNNQQNPLMKYIDFINSSFDMYSYWEMPAGLKTDLPLKVQIEMLYQCKCIDANQELWESYGFREKHEIIGKKYIELVSEKTYDKTFAEFVSSGYQIKNCQSHEKLLSGESFYGLENWFGVVKDGVLTNIWATTVDITEVITLQKEKDALIKKLQDALFEINTLQGILPLCSFCKKVRDDKGYWEKVDVYLQKYTEADISHSICPECMKQHYPEVYKENE